MTKVPEELRSKLKTMIDYWVEHNQEHEAEFGEWADKVSASGEAVAQALRDAASKLSEATASLEQARQALDREPN